MVIVRHVRVDAYRLHPPSTIFLVPVVVSARYGQARIPPHPLHLGDRSRYPDCVLA